MKTARFLTLFSRPLHGLHLGLLVIPAMNRWAIFNRPLMRTRGTLFFCAQRYASRADLRLKAKKASNTPDWIGAQSLIAAHDNIRLVRQTLREPRKHQRPSGCGL